MNNIKLFKDNKGKWYTFDHVVKTLKAVGAHECDTLFVHTDISFGALNPQLKRKQYLGYLYAVLQELNVGTLVFPAFTFSFCNKEVYDVRNSRTPMGVLNEYVRTQPGVIRSIDPILSMIAIGKQANMFDNIGKSSLGKNSAYDILHKSDKVKFLFFGAEIGECFTYIHYMEDMLRVPYRFDMPFTGTIVDSAGNSYEDRYTLYAGCAGVKPGCSYYFEDYLIEQGLLKKIFLGNNPITCITEKDAYREIKGKLESNINYFLQQPFTKEDLLHEYIKGKNGERIVSC